MSAFISTADGKAPSNGAEVKVTTTGGATYTGTAVSGGAYVPGVGTFKY